MCGPRAPVSRSRGGRESGSLLGGQLPYDMAGNDVFSCPGAGWEIGRYPAQSLENTATVPGTALWT